MPDRRRRAPVRAGRLRRPPAAAAGGLGTVAARRRGARGTVAALDRRSGGGRAPVRRAGDADAAVAERARLEGCGWSPWRTGRSPTWPWGTTRRWRPSSRRSRPHTCRAALGARALLTRSGRRADALDVLRQVREVLDEKLGLEPSADCRTCRPPSCARTPSWSGWPAARRRTGGHGGAGGRGARRAALRRRAGRPVADGRTGCRPRVARRRRGGGRARIPSYAVITGDPGIGKSRLVAETRHAGPAAGMRVLVGRCSQDDGAPPLWPWKTVLDGLDGLGARLLDRWPAPTTWRRARAGRPVPGLGVDRRRRARRRPRPAHHGRARRPPLGGHLDAPRPAAARVDDRPGPVAGRGHLALAPGADQDARRRGGGAHGCTPSACSSPACRRPKAATVFAGSRVASWGPQAAALRERTDGNPFFLVGSHAWRGQGGGDGELPDRRHRGHQPPSAAAARADRDGPAPPAVIGRQFDMPPRWPVTGIDGTTCSTSWSQPRPPGLVREDGIDQFLFAHALVRDTLRAQMSASRRARAHAGSPRPSPGSPAARPRSPGTGSRPGRRTPTGPGGPPPRRRRRRLYAYDQAARLLESALVSLDGDEGHAARRFTTCSWR